MVENALLREEVIMLKALLEACHQIAAENLKELARDDWRPNKEILDLKKETIT